jgi:hypothetical protein
MKQSIGEYKQSMYNFFSPVAFFVATCGIIYALLVTGVLTVQPIRLFDLFIVALASFRLIRLFSFDSVFAYVRESIAFNSRIVEENGERYIERTPVRPGFRRMLATLLDCTWCIGLWTTMLCAILYTLSPATALLVVVLAVSAVASLFQIIACLIGAKYEEVEKRTE